MDIYLSNVFAAHSVLHCVAPFCVSHCSFVVHKNFVFFRIFFILKFNPVNSSPESFGYTVNYFEFSTVYVGKCFGREYGANMRCQPCSVIKCYFFMFDSILFEQINVRGRYHMLSAHYWC